jgi:hypothetical protein
MESQDRPAFFEFIDIIGIAPADKLSKTEI